MYLESNDGPSAMGQDGGRRWLEWRYRKHCIVIGLLALVGYTAAVGWWIALNVERGRAAAIHSPAPRKS